MAKRDPDPPRRLSAALIRVVRELNPPLWQVARAQGLGVEEAADVAQTTWLELLRRLHEIRSARALTGWLVTATRARGVARLGAVPPAGTGPYGGARGGPRSRPGAAPAPALR